MFDTFITAFAAGDGAIANAGDGNNAQRDVDGGFGGINTQTGTGSAGHGNDNSDSKFNTPW